MDLTKIDKPFGELNDATKGALLLAQLRGDVIEFWASGWIPIDNPMWSDTDRYRVQPKPVIGEVVLRGAGPIYHSLHPMTLGHSQGYKISVTFPTCDGQHIPGVYTSPEGMQIKVEVAE